ncbi:MAG: cyclic nucleotide-binding domain-containing protein [Nannocystaceae bacterium]|nr:cyclic nucleotide-binding domain-containing protein [Nannocystaceae bacterium]
MSGASTSRGSIVSGINARLPLDLLGQGLELLGIKSGERRRTGLLFAYLLCGSAILVLGRTVRDTLFLSRYSLSALPWMFVLYGIASAITVLLYSRFADRIERARLVVVVVGVAAVTYLLTYVLVRADVGWIYPGFYVWSEVVANLLIVQFWTIANDLHDPRTARRLFPTISAARVVGVVTIGLVSGAVVRTIGTAQLLFVLVGLMVAVAVLALQLRRFPRAEPMPAHTRKGPPPRVMGDRYVHALSLFILMLFAALTIGDYQFKAIARASFREDELAQFFSLFYAITGAVSLVFQIGVTPRLLARFGVRAGMSVMPVVFGIAAAVLPFVPLLSVATVMKFADNGFQYTVHETSMQALYGPFRAEVKARTRALLDAVVKPLSYGAGGLALALLATRVPVHWMSAASCVLVAGCFVVIPVVRRRYVLALERTIGSRAPENGDDFVFDANATPGLLSVLQYGRPSAVLLALDQLERETSPQFVAVLQRLAHAPDAAVRAAALRRIAALGRGDTEAALAGLRDPDPHVRAAAVGAAASLLGDDALEALQPLHDDPAQEVRIAVVASLLLHGGVEGSIEGGRMLATLLAATEPQARVEAARVLRELGPAAYRPVRTLLLDPDAEVRRAALRTARHVADVRLLPLLVDALHRPSTRARAAAALVAIGEAAVEPLAAMLDDPTVPRASRLMLPRILKETPTPRTYAVLRRHVQAPDGHLRLRVLAAMSSVRARAGASRESLATIVAWSRFEVVAAYRNMAAWRAMPGQFVTPLLQEEFDFRRTRAYRRILRVLELRYERGPLSRVRTAIDRRQRRASALEVLDTVMEPPLRPLLLPFFEDIDDAQKLTRAGSLVPSPPPPEQFLIEQCEHANPFVAAIALDALRLGGGATAARVATQRAGSLDPLVREVALRTLQACGAALPAEAIRDPDPVVARLARALAQAQPERTMHSTLEKILMLKGTSLFSTVAAEDLAALARTAEERSFAAGQTIVTEGESGDELFVILSGRVVISRGGRETASLGPGEAFGEISVLDAGPRTATATAVSATDLLAITSEEFYEILYEQAEIAEGVIRMLVKRLRDASAGT